MLEQGDKVVIRNGLVTDGMIGEVIRVVMFGTFTGYVVVEITDDNNRNSSLISSLIGKRFNYSHYSLQKIKENESKNTAFNTHKSVYFFTDSEDYGLNGYIENVSDLVNRLWVEGVEVIGAFYGTLEEAKKYFEDQEMNSCYVICDSQLLFFKQKTVCDVKVIE